MMVRWSGVAALLCWWGSSLALAAEERLEVPKTIEGVRVVASDQVLATMESGAALLIDARKASDFGSGTIPGAVNCQVSSGDPRLDATEVEASMAKLKECLPLVNTDPAKPILTFCNGVTCWRSPKMALALKKMGFREVQWYREGMNDWDTKGLPKR